MNSRNGLDSSQKMRFWRANLTLSPKFVYLGERDLSEGELEWTQPEGLWCIYLYLHSGVLTVNNRSYTYEPGTLSVISPGARAGHTKSGSGAYVFYLSFNLPGQGSAEVALPIVVAHPAREHLMVSYQAAIRSAQEQL